MSEGTVARYYGVIAIEWPQLLGSGPHGALKGWHVAITDAATGKPITTCSQADIHVDANGLVTASLTLFADENGEPMLQPAIRDGHITTGVFPFLVGEMRVRQS